MSVPAPGGRGSALRLALTAAIVVLAWTALSPPWANDLVGGDEGYFGVMARNLLAARSQWAVPSLTPLGAAGDKPPLAPALIAIAIRALGPTAGAVRSLSVLAAFGTLLAGALLARRLAGERAAWVTLLLLGTLPWLADASRVAAAELPLTALGLLALLALGVPAPGARHGLAGGALFGLAFLCKLWLAGLLALPALLFLAPSRGRAAAFAGLGFCVVVGAHLALVQWLAPGDFAHWWNVLWSFSLASRAGGEGFAAYWFHGPGWYAAGLAQAFVLSMPLVAIGVGQALRDAARPFPRMLLGALASLALISLFRVKSGGYLYPLVPMFGVLAAYGFESLLEGRSIAPAVPLAAAVLTAPPVAMRLGGIAPSPWVWGAAWGMFALWSLAAGLRSRYVRRIAWLVLALAVAGGAARIAVRLPQRYHDTGYRDVAAALAPGLADVPPQRVSLLAPEAPAFAFHLFRTARYWDTPYDPWTPDRAASLAADTSLRAFVVDPSQRFYGGGPDSTTLAWLVANTREITADIERRRGTPLPLRVFVRR